MLKNLLFVSALLLASEAQAQAPADGGPAPTGPTAIPLDGGASLLLIGGVGYGAPLAAAPCQGLTAPRMTP